jgi:hypothetical protein
VLSRLVASLREHELQFDHVVTEVKQLLTITKEVREATLAVIRRRLIVRFVPRTFLSSIEQTSCVVEVVARSLHCVRQESRVCLRRPRQKTPQPMRRTLPSRLNPPWFWTKQLARLLLD